MSENYAVISGEYVELTDEQIKSLGVKVRKNPFTRLKNGAADCYYYIGECGNIGFGYESGISINEKKLRVKFTILRYNILTFKGAGTQTAGERNHENNSRFAEHRDGDTRKCRFQKNRKRYDVFGWFGAFQKFL